jgi:hypothetical protein
MQRIFRGFKVRRGLVRELRLAAAWKIQCWFRQYLARQKKTWHQVRRDAITMLSKNIWLMLRFKKNVQIRREGKRLLAPTIKIQRVWRKAAGKKRLHRLKLDRRARVEANSVNDLRVKYILSGVQLRILHESILRDIGKSPFAASHKDCLALGPVQALFLSAVGPRARLGGADDLLANKLDSTNFSRFTLKIKVSAHSSFLLPLIH